MNRSHISDEDLKSYLLGDLPQPARELLEERYLSDDDTYERLLAMEEELIEHHVRGLLFTRQWEPRRKSLLLGEDGPERLRFARALEQLRLQSRRSFRKRLAGGLQQWTHRKALIPAAIGATVLLVSVTLLPESARRGSTNGAHAPTDRPLTRGESHIDGVPLSTVTLFLRSISRDTSAANILRISRGKDRVRLEAELPSDERKPYHVTVRRVDGGQIQTSTDIRKQPAQPGTVLLSAGFSAESFKEGDYIFTIFTATDGHSSEEIMAYTFTVVRTPQA